MLTEGVGPSIARGFLFADLRGYSAFVERHGDRAGAELLRTYRDLVRAVTADFKGAEIRTEGDSFYLAFDSPSSAVLCGLSILERASSTTTPAGHTVPIGIGVHAGETVATQEGYVGSAVNIAARVCAAAGPGELLVTDAVRALTRTYLDVGFATAGRRRLKGISEPIGLYRVTSIRTPVAERRGRVVLPSRTLAAAVAVAGAGLLITVAALVGTGMLGGDTTGAGIGSSPTASPRPSASPAASPSAEGEAFPNAAERSLSAMIEESVARHCERPEPDETPTIQYAGAERAYSGPIPVTAGLRCALGSTSEPDVVWFWQASTSWAADEFFFATAGRRSVPPGDCDVEDLAYGSWEFGDDGGDILCLAGSRDAQVIWTYEEEEILGIAIRGDGDVRRSTDGGRTTPGRSEREPVPDPPRSPLPATLGWARPAKARSRRVTVAG